MAKPETAQQVKVFKAWCLYDRKLIATAKANGVAERTLANWIKAYGWHARADELLDVVVANVNRDLVEQQTEEANHRLDLAQEMAKWGIDFIRGHEPETTADAIRAVKEGIMIERKELGLDKETPQATLPQVNVSVDVRTLVALEIKRLRESLRDRGEAACDRSREPFRIQNSR